MCLLIVLSRIRSDLPLIVAANRDEELARPAVPMDVLGPGILGGLDEMAGGTWLAVNRHGLVAGLTNLPTPQVGRDPTRRSRGELPLALARYETAEEGVVAFIREMRPLDYNPAWLLAADRHSAWYIDLTGGERPVATALEPGIHVLENRALGTPSAKSAAVRAAVEPLFDLSSLDLIAGLKGVLAIHDIPDNTAREVWRPPETDAPCVHAGLYGTRWSAVIAVPPDGTPRFHYADGPPCTAPFVEARWGG